MRGFLHFLLVGAVSSVLLCCMGCSTGAGHLAGNAEKSTTFVAPTRDNNEWVVSARSAGLASDVVVPGTSMSGISIGSERKSVEGLLGSPEGLAESEDPDNSTCIYSNYGIVVQYKDGLVETIVGVGKNSDQNVEEYRGKTIEGLGMGSTRGVVVKVLGKPEINQEDHVVYGKKGLYFGFVNGRVNLIGVTSVNG